jgi:hypothetical protein
MGVKILENSSGQRCMEIHSEGSQGPIWTIEAVEMKREKIQFDASIYKCCVLKAFVALRQNNSVYVAGG